LLYFVDVFSVVVVVLYLRLASHRSCTNQHTYIHTENKMKEDKLDLFSLIFNFINEKHNKMSQEEKNKNTKTKEFCILEKKRVYSFSNYKNN